MAMLARVLGAADVASLASVVARLVSERTEERQDLEFKAGIDPDARRLAERIAGMANGGGGIIVFGVGEQGSRAARLEPFALQGAQERLSQIVNAHVRPHLRVTCYPVEAPAIAPAGLGFVVLEIPPSASSPHAVAVNDRLGFPKRDHSVLHWMTEADVERAYRDRRERILESSASLDRLEQAISAYPGPSGLWMVAVPQTLRTALLPALHEALARAKGLLQQQRHDPDFGPDLPENVRVGFRRLEFARRWQGGWPQSEWSWFESGGGYVSWRPARETTRIYTRSAPPKDTPPSFFALEGLLFAVTGCLTGLRSLAREFRLSDELDLRLGLQVRQGILLWQDEAWGCEPEGHLGSTRENVRVESAVHSDELFVGRQLLGVAKRLLDDLVSAFGVGEFGLLSSEGSLRLDRFSSFWKERMRPWAERVGATIE